MEEEKKLHRQYRDKYQNSYCTVRMFGNTYQRFKNYIKLKGNGKLLGVAISEIVEDWLDKSE